ncbi:MAG: hypothetical protein WB947_07765 [Thermoplasmata archaeon]
MGRLPNGHLISRDAPADHRSFLASGQPNLFDGRRVPGRVRSNLRTVGILGAVFLLVGVSLLGAGYAYTTLASENLIDCRTNCVSAFDADQNATIVTDFLWAFGFIAIGVGTGLILAVAVTFMDRWPPGAGGVSAARQAETVRRPPAPP